MVGCQKSGTTWLQRLLNAHPEVVCRGEHQLCNVLLPMGVALVREWSGKINAPAPTKLDNADAPDVVRLVSGLLFAKWAGDEMSTLRAIGEKTPQHAYALPALSQLFPGCRVIHIIRDGRDCVVSGWYHNKRDNPLDHERRFPSRAVYAKYFAEHHWVPYISKARAWGQPHAQQYREVRYETMLEHPESTVESLLSFLGVDNSRGAVETCIQAASFEKLSRGRTRGEADDNSFFRKGVAGDWHDELDAEAVAAFESIGAPLMLELGYEPVSTVAKAG